MKSYPISAIKRYLASCILASPEELSEIEKLTEEAMMSTLSEAMDEGAIFTAKKALVDDFSFKRHYFACIRLHDALQSYQSASMSIFSGFSSQAMTKWILVINKLQKNNLFLSEAMRILVNEVYVSIPELRRCRQDTAQSISELKLRVAQTKELLASTSKKLSDIKTIRIPQSTLSEVYMLNISI